MESFHLRLGDKKIALPDVVKGQIIIIRKRWGMVGADMRFLDSTNKKKTYLKTNKSTKIVLSVVKRVCEKHFNISLLICSCYLTVILGTLQRYFFGNSS